MMNYRYIIIILTVFSLNLTLAQTPDWQWAKRGGGTINLQGNETTSTGVERVLDLKIDSNNNYYYLAEVSGAQTDYDGMPITTYNNNNTKDIYMFSTDCQGNFRWSKSIGVVLAILQILLI
ncbi:hypothetical protein [Flavobacterium sp. CS20]|uniref:hypothetical protein n=1 Tax=Flavobacterium sp. CS20 TaxID=2775246 RepID=UPI001B3A6C5A|nr:hypothetical protein [Flavobacterium sp. CS20]QTY26145.1 hypothetical protein IGB25_09150 [Flavobacterium sp. CS20]